MYNKTIRPTLKSKKWEKFRDRIMRKYDYLCQESLRYGISTQAEMVHHIFPVSEYPELEFVEWNCLPLTNKKHNTFHDRVNDKVINQGLYWQKKRKKDFEDFYKAPPTFLKLFFGYWVPVKGTFSKSGAFKQKGGKN